MTRNKLWESAALLLIAFTLFRPGFWLDMIQPPFQNSEPTTVYEVVGGVPPNGQLTFVISGPDFDTGEVTSTTILVPMGDQTEAVERLEAAGLMVMVEDGLARVEEPFPQTPFFEKIGTMFDYYGDEPVTVSEIKTEAERMPKEIFYIPAFLLLGLIYMMQRRRSPVA